MFRWLCLILMLPLAACGGAASIQPHPYEGVYGVLCLQADGGYRGMRLDFKPTRETPGADLILCDGRCVRPRVVAIELHDADLTFDTRDGVPPQDGVSVAPERHWVAAFDNGIVSLQGDGAGYVLPATILKKDDRTCPAGSQPAEPRVEMAP